MSLILIAFVKFDDSVLQMFLEYSFFLCFLYRVLILASVQRCGPSFLECKYTHTTMYLWQLICYNENLDLVSCGVLVSTTLSHLKPNETFGL